MHVQIPEVVIGDNWGKLGLLGRLSQGIGFRPSADPHLVQLILQFPSDFKLGSYIDNSDEELNLFDRHFKTTGTKFFYPLDVNGMRHLIFELPVTGEIRNPEGYLMNVVRRLHKLFDRISDLEEWHERMMEESTDPTHPNYWQYHV